ncbi:MAG: helix-turn-helix transcriptional regulator [Acidimicrobiales bacterium]|jgi:DNA-binding HxlR family transcriptional regulator|nr:helix-turn-helix transcriptional regulator [Acidimicrobiales bacterium]
MRRTSFAQWPCSVARTTDLLGDWWTPLVLRDACYGVRRFEDFQRRLGISRNILTERLNRLVDEGMLERVPYREHPLRHEYRLTDKGRDFFPVLAAMMRWGDRWLAPDGPPVVLHHTTCDHDIDTEVVCGHCGEPLRLSDVTARFPHTPPHRSSGTDAQSEGTGNTSMLPPSTGPRASEA